ncbi:unnamed protein product [Dovyalis caffra]|uniref:NF-X1-type domain-containing protein n=1 Tax=Dovyalis caffra TaxID=77055 RepID=A0AAV1QYN6_9ROSI|nr:unnamed protein product [Dovyalis caffra]
MRDCGRHACKRRCCDGDCPPCGEICGKRLRCRNHKCPAPCHRGACAPCPVMFTISCACGETHFEVPCGTEMDQKPPKCRKSCGISPLCRHGLDSKPHKCHYGACPPCRLLCNEEYPCGHNCKLRCHGPRPPPNPDFTLRPKKKKPNNQSESTPGSPCPPCPELVWRPCVGQHIGAERMVCFDYLLWLNNFSFLRVVWVNYFGCSSFQMICSDITQFSCENLCGNPLSCGNHYCTKTCHALNSQSSTSLVQHKRSESCEECHLPCEKVINCFDTILRCCKQGTAACLSAFLPSAMSSWGLPPCKVLVKRSCHCGSMVHVFECIYYNNLSEKEQMAARSCGGPCHRKLPNCTHLCPKTCHPGQCPSPDKCTKKLTVRCQCQTLKKEMPCQEVQAAHRKAGSDPKGISKNHFGLGLLLCNSGCKSKAQVVDQELHLRKSKDLEEKVPATENHAPKRRKRRERLQETKKTSRLQKITVTMKWLLLIVTLVVTLVAAAYFGYKGLMWLSDWMNEVEEQQRQRKRYPRI